MSYYFKSKSKYFPFLSTMLFLVFVGCILPNEPVEEVIYYNSFESSQDTVGWFINADVHFAKDAAPKGGNQSLFVSGGCLVPHAYFEIGAFDEDVRFKIRCWCKKLVNGGSVDLELVNDRYQQIYSINVTNSTWTYCESDSVLLCPNQNKLRVSLNSGGFIPGSMLVDMIEIIKLK